MESLSRVKNTSVISPQRAIAKNASWEYVAPVEELLWTYVLPASLENSLKIESLFVTVQQG